LEGSIFARALTSELHHDKDKLQKQLELVTLRLPAPKVGFWARLFWRRGIERRIRRMLAYFGLGTLNAWQIAYAVNSLTSLCRGTDAICLFAGL
jgi:16S rRNA U516 pseudouridylate synthase RsuA-like enzyme